MNNRTVSLASGAGGRDPLAGTISGGPARQGSPRLRVVARTQGREIYAGTLEAREGLPLRLGRSADTELTIDNPYISKTHGLLLYQQGQWFFADAGSTNGTFVGGEYLSSAPGEPLLWQPLHIPTVLKIDRRNASLQQHVEILLTYEERLSRRDLPLGGRDTLSIGRDPGCTIHFPHVSVSRIHAYIRPDRKGYVVTDNHSTNGTTLNGRPVSGSARLSMHSIIRVGRNMVVFMGDHVQVYTPTQAGAALTLRNLRKVVKERGKDKVLLSDVSLDIAPGELVAIIGGSGAGKSTLMNAISGFTGKTGGSVQVDGQDFMENYAALKSIIGYVPQQDIVYDTLTVERMLLYAAKMRMPQDTTLRERKERVDRVLATVLLTEDRKKPIKKLSGGQRKRASIAVELLADPTLFFLDEPASGLDPGTEESLMLSLKALAKEGKTILLVTHSTLHLSLCDKIIVMGNGGRLCYAGPAAEICPFFGVKSFAGVYRKLGSEENAERWRQAFAGLQAAAPAAPVAGAPVKGRKGISGLRQYQILTQRYAEMMLRSGKQMLSILGQALAFAVVLVLVSDGDLYQAFGATQTVCFVMACLGMWMGLFLSIQEITKERPILRREYMANLKLPAYIFSKVTVIFIIALVQVLVMLGGFLLLSHLLGKNLPTESILLPPWAESIVTLFLTSAAAACMGLMVSALVRQPERFTPYLLMPQIVFSGVLFQLGDSFDWINRLVFTYWGNRALCASADVNALGLRAAAAEVGWDLAPEFFSSVQAYDHTTLNLLLCWGALAALGAVMLLIAVFALRSLKKNERG